MLETIAITVCSFAICASIWMLTKRLETHGDLLRAHTRAPLAFEAEDLDTADYSVLDEDAEEVAQ